MSIYYIGSYDIHDREMFAQYPPGVVALLPKYGGEVRASDTQAICVEGQARTMNAIIEFPSVEAAFGLYNDPLYEPLKRLRLASTNNASLLLVKRFGI